jgi:predicted dehydrogenase
MNHICIIGAGGVGKAHALAAAKYLERVEGATITLVDTKDVLDQHFHPFITNWHNSWGPIKDSITVSPTIKVKRIFIDQIDYSPQEVFDLNADLYIIATPNATHYDYLTLLKGKVVLCEKPLVAYGQGIPTITSTTHLGIEWLYHSQIKLLCGEFLSRIEFVHAFPPEAAMWDTNHEIYDLGSHVISIYQYITGYDRIEYGQATQDGRVTTVNILDDHKTELIFGYDRNAVGDSILINGHIKVDWIPFDQGDLFYRQIAYIMVGHPPKLDAGKIYEGTQMLEVLYGETL